MYGAIAGDIIGSLYEGFNIKTTEFELFKNKSRFTDDTVLTVAIADALLSNKDYTSKLQEYGRKYPNAGYGGTFYKWIFSDNPQPYNSWGNGSAMRVSPVAYAFDNLERVLNEAEKSAAVTHNHPEGVKGAQAIATAIFLARKGKSKSEIKSYIQNTFSYDLERTIDNIRPQYTFDVSCQGSVPEAIIAFLESNSFEDAVRLAVSIGGDSDTIAAMAGSISEAFYGEVPGHILEEVKNRLPGEFIKVIETFNKRFYY
jgi:ADP-ribosylglycohydrolase